LAVAARAERRGPLLFSGGAGWSGMSASAHLRYEKSSELPSVRSTKKQRDMNSGWLRTWNALTPAPTCDAK